MFRVHMQRLEGAGYPTLPQALTVLDHIPSDLYTVSSGRYFIDRNGEEQVPSEELEIFARQVRSHVNIMVVLHPLYSAASLLHPYPFVNSLAFLNISRSGKGVEATFNITKQPPILDGQKFIRTLMSETDAAAMRSEFRRAEDSARARELISRREPAGRSVHLSGRLDLCSVWKATAVVELTTTEDKLNLFFEGRNKFLLQNGNGV